MPQTQTFTHWGIEPTMFLDVQGMQAGGHPRPQAIGYRLADQVATGTVSVVCRRLAWVSVRHVGSIAGESFQADCYACPFMLGVPLSRVHRVFKIQQFVRILPAPVYLCAGFLCGISRPPARASGMSTCKSGTPGHKPPFSIEGSLDAVWCVPDGRLVLCRLHHDIASGLQSPVLTYAAFSEYGDLAITTRFGHAHRSYHPQTEETPAVVTHRSLRV